MSAVARKCAVRSVKAVACRQLPTYHSCGPPLLRNLRSLPGSPQLGIKSPSVIIFGAAATGSRGFSLWSSKQDSSVEREIGTAADAALETGRTSEFVDDASPLFEDPYFNSSVDVTSSTDSIQEVVTESVKSSVGAVVQAAEHAQSSGYVGYLQSIGQAQTWIWPADICQHLLELFHVYADYSWAASIIAVTVALRIVVFPFFLKSSDISARSAAIQPEMDKLLRDYMSQSAEERQDIHEVQRRRLELMRSNGVNMKWMLAPLLVNLFVGFGMFLGLERMANADIPDFKHQTGFWFEDLTKPDPYYILNIGPALLLAFMFRRGGETGVQSMSPKVQRIMVVAPLISLVFTLFLPSAVMLYFLTSSSMSVLQAMILRNPRFRAAAKMHPIVARAPPSPEAQENLRSFWESAKKAAEDASKKKR